MGLFDIFKRKPGGTFVGNLLRGTAKGIASAINPKLGAIVGNGAMMITQEAYDLKNLSDADYIAKYGTTKTGAPPQASGLGQAVLQNAGTLATMAGQVLNPNIMPVQQRIDAAQAGVAGAATQAGIAEFGISTLKKYWWAIAFPVVGLVVFLLARKKRR